jgi:hypothetical protein
VKYSERDWFRGVSWEAVLSMNQSFCEAQQTPYQIREKACQAAQQAWQNAAAKRMPMAEAVEVCRRCYDLSPFVFNNGNTFAAAARKLIEEWLQALPPVEGQIARTTIGHYIVGQIERKELVQVLQHFESRWPLRSIEQPAVTPPLRELRPQARATIS